MVKVLYLRIVLLVLNAIFKLVVFNTLVILCMRGL